MPLLSVLAVLGLVLTSLSSAAAGLCEPLFTSETVEFSATESFRVALINRADELRAWTQRGRADYTRKFMGEIAGRNQTTPQRIGLVMRASPALSRPNMQTDNKSILPPEISSETFELIKTPNTESASLAEALERDPYFSWLKHNSLRYQASQNDNLQAIHKHRTPPFDQADPIALFISSRKEGLRPELALMRVMRAMDPVLSADAVWAASGALFHGALEGVLVDKIIPTLSTRNKSDGELDPWSYVPSAAEGERHLRKLLDEQVVKFGKILPRASFERLLHYVDSRRYQFLMSEYRARRYAGKAELETLELLNEPLRKMRADAGLSKDFPISRLYDIVDRAYTLQELSSYESVLADIFDPPKAKLIRELRFITEIASGLSTDARADAYLRSLVEP